MPHITLGVNNGFAIKNWPEPSAWTKIIAEDLGVKEVQFSFDLLDPRIPEPGRSAICNEIVKEITKNGIVIRTTFTGLLIYSQNHLAHPNIWYRREAFNLFVSALEVTRKLNAEGSGGYIGNISLIDQSNHERRALIRSMMIVAVKKLTKIASLLGLKYFLLELMPNPGEIPHTPEEAIDLIEELNIGCEVPVLICFDLGHTASYDFKKVGDPYKWLEKLLPYTCMLHLQQTDGKGDRHWPFTPEYNERGIIDPKRIIEILKSSSLKRVNLILEFVHALDIHPQKIIDDYKYSVEYWLRNI